MDDVAEQKLKLHQGLLNVTVLENEIKYILKTFSFTSSYKQILEVLPRWWGEMFLIPHCVFPLNFLDRKKIIKMHLSKIAT